MIKVIAETQWEGPAIKIQGKKVINKTVYETALWIESQAKLLCARRYGYLAASINTQMRDKGTKLENPSKYSQEIPPAGHSVDSFQEVEKPTKQDTAYVGTAVDYGPWVEFGTVRMNAQPFMRPAFDLAGGKVLEIGRLNGRNYFKDYLQ